MQLEVLKINREKHSSGAKCSSRPKLYSDLCLATETAAASDAGTRFILTDRTKKYTFLLKDRKLVMQ